MRTAFKEDLRASVAELVYGEPLRIPGELLTPCTGNMEPSELIQQLLRLMDQLHPAPAARYASPTTFVHKDLMDSTHEFMRQDALRLALEPPYSGPFKVLGRTDKTFKIAMHGKSITVSADRIKPAYVMDEAKHEPSTASPPPARATQPAVEPSATTPPAEKTTPSGRRVRFPSRYEPRAAISAGGRGGDVGTLRFPLDNAKHSPLPAAVSPLSASARLRRGSARASLSFPRKAQEASTLNGPRFNWKSFRHWAGPSYVKQPIVTQAIHH